ncbi:MAG: phytanoyl-CoA dioxygenase family protein, partial [Rhizobiales bacterium]|nr:phytanoyl-CoA dioxygenase family protein [Hyphomicrobiales bacterium]
MSGLSPEEQRHYTEQGYVIPSYRLPADQLAELREAVDWVIENNPDARPEHLVSVHVINNEPERIKGHPAFLDLVGDPAILDLVESAIGRNILLWGAHLFCKPVKTGMEVPMHQDGE